MYNDDAIFVARQTLKPVGARVLTVKQSLTVQLVKLFTSQPVQILHKFSMCRKCTNCSIFSNSCSGHLCPYHISLLVKMVDNINKIAIRKLTSSPAKDTSCVQRIWGAFIYLQTCLINIYNLRIKNGSKLYANKFVYRGLSTKKKRSYSIRSRTS